MISFLLRIPVFKRLIPSIFKKYIKLSKKYIKTIYINGIYYELDVRHLIDRRFYLHRSYENELYTPIRSIIKKYEVEFFFDIGSCWGVYSLQLSNQFQNLKIISYDPITKNIDRLNKLIKINNIKNIKTFKLALGNHKEIVELGATETFSPNYEIGEKKAVITEKCKMDKLDNLHFLKDKTIIIKIDTEGFEYNVLMGAQQILKDNKIFCQVEIKKQNYEKVLEFMNRNNFKLISDNQYNKTDFFFSNFINEKISI